MGSKEILNLLYLNDYNDINIETMIEIVFLAYKHQKKKYDSVNFLPQNLIKLYYTRDNHHSDFSNIIFNFKKKYIVQESKLEGVHTPEEINGLGLVYDYIRSDDWKQCPNIYVIMMINLKLFSLTPYPEAGGKIRNADCILKGSDVNVCPYNQIAQELSKLYFEFDKLLKKGMFLAENSFSDDEEFMAEREDKMIEYINECLKLKCHLIQIHPFQDGNGRTMRALVNMLFKVAGIPPVYVRLSERKRYLEAMNKAISEKDYTNINQFYYYKICDSILELDLNQRIKQELKPKILKKK